MVMMYRFDIKLKMSIKAIRYFSQNQNYLHR